VRTPKNRVLNWVIGVHIVLVLGAVTIPLVQKLFRPKKKEIITFVAIDDGSIPAPPDKIQPVEVERLPEPESIDIPIQTNKPPKKVEKPKLEPKPEKKKWKAAPVQRQNNRVTKDRKKPVPATPARKRITASDIQKALGTAGGTPSAFAAYYQTILTRFYSVWQVPVGTAYGVSAQASIQVGPDGTVSNRRLIRPSGNSAFDQSVQSALQTVNRLPAPPSNLPSRTITIDFVPQ
jgi:TonB family protein